MEKKYIIIDGQLCPLNSENPSVFSKDKNGLVPAPNSDEELYLKSDGTWSAITDSDIESIPLEEISGIFN